MKESRIRAFVSRVRDNRSPRPLGRPHADVTYVRQIHGRRFPTLRQCLHIRTILSVNERRIFSVGLFGLLVGVVWFGQVFANTYRIEVPAIGGSYVEAMVGSPQFINPLFASINDVDVDLTRLIFSGLMRYDKKQRLVPDLAVTYEVSEDKKIYRFALRENVVWHDGEPFTAKDVSFTFETIQNKAVESPLFVGFQGVKIEVIDDYTIQFILAEPFAPFLSSLTVGILPLHVWANVLPERMRLVQQNLQPVGTGPFAFQKFEKDSSGRILSYELVRFEGSYRQPPFLEEFIFRFYTTYDGGSSPVQDLREGRIDGLSFVPQDVRERVARKHIVLHTLQLPQYTALFFNQDDVLALQNEDVRTALTHAIDKERIVRESLQGEGTVIAGPILPGFPGYNPEQTSLSYDIAVANELLDKKWERIAYEVYREERREILIDEWRTAQMTTSTKGVEDETNASENAEDNIDGNEIKDIAEDVLEGFERQLDQELNPAQTFFRKNSVGDVLRITLTTSDAPEQRHAAELIAGFWQEVGVHTSVKFVDPKNITSTVLKRREYDVLLYGVIVGSDPDQYPFWHSSQVDFPGLNLSGYENRSVDTLLEKTRESTDEFAVMALYQKFQETILTDKPAVFLYTPIYTYATVDNIQGIDVARISHPSDRFSNVIQWYSKTKGQWHFGEAQ